MQQNRVNRPRLAQLASGILAGMLALAGLALAQEKGLPACHHTKANGGMSGPIKLPVMEKEYARLKTELSKAVGMSAEQARSLLDRPLDAGLPACSSASRVSRILPRPLPPKVRGRAFAFLSAGNPERVAEIAEREKKAILFVTRAPKLADLVGFSRKVGRPIEIATRELTELLGVTCIPTVVTVSENGERLDLAQGE